MIHLVDIACLTESQKLDPDKAVHIMHITVGTSAVHLVGKKSVMEFDMFTMSLYEEDMGLLNQAGVDRWNSLFKLSMSDLPLGDGWLAGGAFTVKPFLYD